MAQTYFSRRLRELRSARNMSTVDLADAAGIDRTAVHRLEHGERAPSWPTVEALAEALGVSTEEFREK